MVYYGIVSKTIKVSKHNKTSQDDQFLRVERFNLGLYIILCTTSITPFGHHISGDYGKFRF